VIVPGDLRDPEQFQTFQYDPRYDATPNQFDPMAFNMDEYLQSIATETLNQRINQKLLDDVKSTLETEGYFHRNPGDESFRKKVKTLLMAKRMAAQWLI